LFKTIAHVGVILHTLEFFLLYNMYSWFNDADFLWYKCSCIDK